MVLFVKVKHSFKNFKTIKNKKHFLSRMMLKKVNILIVNDQEEYIKNNQII